MPGFFDRHPEAVTLTDRPRCAQPKGAMQTRLDEKIATGKQLAKQQAVFVAAVWGRDKVCVHCRRKVVKSLELKPNRGEVHHLSGRRVKPEDRFNVARAVLLCAACHQRATRHEITVAPPKEKA